jgi:flavorubredoxin
MVVPEPPAPVPPDHSCYAPRHGHSRGHRYATLHWRWIAGKSQTRGTSEGRPSTKIAIVYHSETGNTRQMAELVQQGCVAVPGVEARCMSIDELDAGYVADAKAVLMASARLTPRFTAKMARSWNAQGEWPRYRFSSRWR